MYGESTPALTVKHAVFRTTLYIHILPDASSGQRKEMGYIKLRRHTHTQMCVYECVCVFLESRVMNECEFTPSYHI